VNRHVKKMSVRINAIAKSIQELLIANAQMEQSKTSKEIVSRLTNHGTTKNFSKLEVWL